jgi:uncharacterized membrane protein
MANDRGRADGGSERGLLDGGGGNELGEEFKHLLSAVANRALSGASDRVGGLTDKLADIGEGGGLTALGKAGEKTAEGKSPVVSGLAAGAEGIKEKVKSAFGGDRSGGGGKKLKVTSIIESIDIGAPIDVAYNQWTQFQDFSKFMKKVEGVDQQDERKLTFKAQVLWSHRTWEATIVDQVPNDRIVWSSKGEKGRVDGAVTFHELAPNLTRVLVVLEYHPQGLFERTGNLWRAQGRRARLELKHFRRHVMTQAMLHPDDLEGWRGEIHDSKVTKGPDEVADEQNQDQDRDQDYDEGEDEEDYEDDELDDDELDDDEKDYDDDDDDEDEEAVDSETEDDGEQQPRRRSHTGRR